MGGPVKRRFLVMGAAAALSVAAVVPVAAEAGAATPASLPHSMAQLHQLLHQMGWPGAGSHRAGIGPKVVTPSQWSEVPAPTFGSVDQALESVSCPTATDCMAVGATFDGTKNTPVAATRTGGTWTAVPVPASTDGPSSALISVSCPTTTFCAAVGQVSTTGSTPTTTPIGESAGTSLIEQWDGNAWRIVPSPGSGETDLFAVSCPTATDCTAIGTGFTATKPFTTTVVDRWNGSTWTATRLPSPATAIRIALGVSCTGATFCMVTGFQLALTGTTATAFSTFSLRWDGTSWTTVPTATLGPTVFLQVPLGVSCATPTLCTTVGAELTFHTFTATATTTGVRFVGLIQQWNGSTWTAMATPGPATNVELRGVDCFGPTSCVATGSAPSSTPHLKAQSVVENWNGTAWSQAALPPVAAATATTSSQALLGVSCVANAQCVAVGENSPKALTMVAPVARSGYEEVASDGGLFAFTAPFYGSMGGKPLNKPVVGMAMTPDGGGYWEVASDGGIFAFGDAQFYGSMGGKPLNQPIVGIAATPSGNGYWEVASDGGIFAFGDAAFHGSMGGKPLNEPVVGIAGTPSGGYYEVAADGGLFAYTAPFLGSMGGQPLNEPVVGMTVTPAGGYYEVAADGGLFAYTAPFLGSMGGKPLNEPVVGMTVNSGGGYYEVATDGGLFAFGAPFLGSMGGKPLNQPIVGMAQ